MVTKSNLRNVTFEALANNAQLKKNPNKNREIKVNLAINIAFQKVIVLEIYQYITGRFH